MAYTESDSNRSAAVLAKRAAKGDMVALEALYRRHVEAVWRFAWLRSSSKEMAADVVQDTFLRVMRSIGQFKGQSAFGTWLFTLARSAAIEIARREQRERAARDKAGVLRLVPSPSVSPADRPDGEIRLAVRRAVAELPGAQRDAIVLCELTGLSIREAAEVLSWGESRVKVTLFRARRRLREKLRRHVSDERVDRRDERE